MSIKTIACGAALVSLIAASALAHSGATGVVKERMMGMGVMGKAVKAIASMMQGELPYNPDRVRTAAEDIGSHAGGALTKLFPEGTNKKPSEAKAAIWTNWDRFEALAEDLHLYSEGLALASVNGVMAGGDAPASDMMGGSAMMGSATMMGSASMMGDDAMMGGQAPLPGLEELAEMPANAVFTLMSQTCAACHTQFRAESK